MKRLTLLSLLAAGLLACSGSPKTGPVGPGGDTAGGDGTATDGSGGTTATNWKSGPPKKVTTVEGITEYQLDNGMRVLLFPDQSQEKVTVNITFFVGSRHEGYGEAGMAHLLEHMVFKGTPDHPDIWKLLQDHGAQFNGTTWYDRTNYYETLPANPENLKFAIEMEADRMVNSTISPDELAKEFSVVRNEFEMGENSPKGVLEERMVSAAFLWHNYGKSTIGNRSDIERVPADRLRAFYEKYYRPDNAMLIVAGKFDEAKALELIHDNFGTIPKPEKPLPETYTQEPVQDGEKTVILRRAGDSKYVGVLYHGVPGAHEKSLALDAASTILTDKPSGPLYKALVESKLATKVSSASYPTKEPGYVLFFAEVPADKPLEPVRDKMLEVIESYGKSKITKTEVNRFIRRQQKQLEQLMSSSQQAAIALTEFAAMGDWRLLFIIRDRLEKITTDDVATAASAYFKRSNRTVGMFIPTKEIDRAPLPEQPDVLALVKDYKGREEMAEGEAFEATFANVEARTERHTLASGMKLALLPKKTRGGKVTGQISIRFADARSLRGKTTAADLVGDMLLRGTVKKSYQELRDELDALKTSLSISSAGPGTAVISLTTKKEHLMDVVALLGEILTQPSFPKDQFEIITREQLTTLESQQQDPQALAITALQRTLAPYPKNDVRYVPTIPESIAELKKAKLADVKKIHGQYWGSGAATAAFVGDFDSGELKGALEQALGSWKAKKKYKRIEQSYIKTKGGEETINTPDKKMAFIIAAKTLKIRDDHPDYAALTMVGYVMGGGASSRLLNRLRQKEGLSYGAFGAIQAGSLDEVGAMFGGAILAPENADKGMALMMEEIRKLFADGIPEKELADAKAAYLKQTKNQIANDGFLVSVLDKGLFVGRTTEWNQAMNDKIAKLTPADIKAAIGKHLSADGMFKVKAGDLADKAKSDK